jgi:predicted transcriptional regulator
MLMMNDTPTENNEDEGLLLELSVDILVAYVTKNAVPITELPKLVGDVCQALMDLNGPKTASLSPAIQAPAVDPKKSVTDDYIICLEDGKKCRMLGYHIQNKYNLSPAEYRKKWDLSRDYPMNAPAYSKKRSQIAKAMRLGFKSKHSA